MLSRQRIIISMLSEANNRLNKLDLVKLLFLLYQENPSIPKAATIEFLPYHRGPYSFTLAHDLKNLESAGLLEQSTCNITLTDLGKVVARETPFALRHLVTKTHKAHGAKGTKNLIDYVYSTFDWYTVNSKWVHRRAYPRPVADIAIYTTSYEAVHLDGLLDRLMRKGIQRLIDVRANPVARRFGFHKSTLARICPRVGIEYIHVPEVGIPGSWRSDLDSFEAYQKLFRRYEKEVLPDQLSTLNTLSSLITDKPSAMMCKEADPKCCHRTALAHRLAQDLSLPIIDLGS